MGVGGRLRVGIFGVVHMWGEHVETGGGDSLGVGGTIRHALDFSSPTTTATGRGVEEEEKGT